MAAALCFTAVLLSQTPSPTSGRRAINRHKTALVITNGVTTYNGTYSYDGAGRLSQVVDTATTPATTEVYTWNNDGTMANAPGVGYAKLFEYDEDQHLTRIQHNTNGTITTAYDYGYAADGGRRWQKDYANNVWTWYPCGVACNAGELVEQTSNLTGNTWTTSALYLKAGSGCGAQIIRRNAEYHHQDTLGNIAAITGTTGTIVSSTLNDNFEVQRFSNGTAQSTWSTQSCYRGADGLSYCAITCVLIPQRVLSLSDKCGARGGGKPKTPCNQRGSKSACLKCCGDGRAYLEQYCLDQERACQKTERNFDVCWHQYDLCMARVSTDTQSCARKCDALPR